MKKTFSIIVFMTMSLTMIGQENPTGTWKIDLRPTPDSEAYYQSLVISKVGDNKLEGTFYGSAIKDGFLNRQWDRLYFAFSTSDSTNEYYHSGYVLNGKVYGISYCPNRAFTAPWTGIKE